MQDLRLVGVHDDGEHLLLSGTGGEIYRLRIDEALRVAASRTAKASRMTARAADVEKPRLSPRDIQMQIRAGASAESVAESSGLELAHIRRYEGPVLAEREYIARQARAVEVSAAVPAHDGYRSAFGDNPASLEEMVACRLTAFGINPASVVWDAWRRPDGTWTVTADFDSDSSKSDSSKSDSSKGDSSKSENPKSDDPKLDNLNNRTPNSAAPKTGTHPQAANSKGAASGAIASIGEPAPAQWVFSPGRRTIHNSNRWAQQLSELEPLDGPLPARRLTAVADRPFDFEAQPAIDAESVDDDEPAGADPASAAENLLDMLRSRRGQRLGVDEDEDDALASLLTSGIPAAHPRSLTPPSENSAGSDSTSDGLAADNSNTRGTDSNEAEDGSSESGAQRGPEGRSRLFPGLSLAPRHPEPSPDSIELHDVSTQTREVRISAAPKGAPAQEIPDRAETTDRAERADRKAAVKPKRSSVPSWDEIVFGTKGD
ncbi:DUF3071 domain-containing protein [Paeniglutamicibacter antarcticus]|uniref:DUF3071 domain-containing protein n=1 Tax=Arthrobacter terrae TaxID=2935737 RepID=A0A931CN53_9MICC|nr:septation protein SepH [Arthrobacter terrae]MBG0741652.1 DUF3071 domain-containing protein [Arthrobacter terrae]